MSAAAPSEGTPLRPVGTVKRKLREQCPSLFDFNETWSPDKARGTLEPWGFSVGLAAEMFPRGFLPLAAGFTAVGIPYTLLLISLVFAGATFSMWAVGRVSEATGESTWRGQWAKLLGPRTSFVPVVVVMAMCFTCCSCMLALAGNLAGGLSIVPFGKLGALVVMVGVLSRIVTTRRSFSEMEGVATVAAVTSALSALVVLWRTCDGSYMQGGAYENSVYIGGAHFKNGPLDVVPRMEMIVLLSLLCNAFLVHHNSCKLYRELERHSSKEHWTWTHYTFFAMLGVYFAVMAAGVATFGTNVQMVVLDNYASEDFLGGIARLANAIALVCSLPLTFAALREATSDLMSDISTLAQENLKFVAGQNVLAVVLLMLVALCAWAMDNPYQVVGLTGCFFGACCSFILPCVLLYAVQQSESDRGQRDLRRSAFDESPREAKIVLGVLCLGVVTFMSGAVAPLFQRQYYFVDFDAGPVFRQSMHNFEDMQYYGEVTIGGQALRTIMDTGSSEFVVLSDKCHKNCGEHTKQLFHSESSHSYLPGELQLMLKYGSGQVLGSEAYDEVQVGPLRAKQVPFWEGIDADMQPLGESNFQAIAGLGPVSPDTRLFRPGSAGNMNAWAALMPAMGVRRFSICLGQKPGSDGYITWNDDSRIKRPELFSKVHVPPTGYWMAQLTDVRLGSKLLACGHSCGGIVDSGTSLMALPGEHLSILQKAINSLNPDCRNMRDLPNLTFKLGGVPVSLGADAYLAEFDGDLKELDNPHRSAMGKNETNATLSCQPALIEAALDTYMGPTWIIGMPFFRQYYTVFVQSAKFTPAAMYVAPATRGCHPEGSSEAEERHTQRTQVEGNFEEAVMVQVKARSLRRENVQLPRWLHRQQAIISKSLKQVAPAVPLAVRRRPRGEDSVAANESAETHAALPALSRALEAAAAPSLSP